MKVIKKKGQKEEEKDEQKKEVIKMQSIKEEKKEEEKREDLTWIILRESYSDDEGTWHYIFCTRDKKQIFKDYKDGNDYIEFLDADGEPCILTKEDIIAIHR